MINDIRIIFLSIVLEALPFILVGSFIASIVHIYVTEKTIERFLPKNRYLQIFAMAIIALILPLCECTVAPISKRLIKRGVSVSTVTTFFLATPVGNPMAILTTYIAFGFSLKIALLRVSTGLLIATIIGLISIRIKKIDFLKDNSPEDAHHHAHANNHSECTCSCSCTHGDSQKSFRGIIKHTLTEFLDVGRFIILGAFFGAAFQVLMPITRAGVISENLLLSMLLMAAFAYLISLCSHADAFVGASLMGIFPFTAIMTFMIIGPFIDVKNTLIYGSFIKKRHLIKLILKIVIISLLFLRLAHYFYGMVL